MLKEANQKDNETQKRCDVLPNSQNSFNEN